MHRVVERPTRQGSRHTQWILLVLLLSLLPLSSAFAVCSSYHRFATINEIYRSGNSRFLEVKLLQQGITASTYDGWNVRVCSVATNRSCSPLLSLAGADDGDLPYIVIGASQLTNRDWIDLSGGMYAELTDAAGDTIDWVMVTNDPAAARALWPEDASCQPAFDEYAPTGNSHTMHRMPDGTGEWVGASGNSGGNSGGDPNTGGGGGGTLQTVAIADVGVEAGAPAVFTLTLSAAVATDVVVSYTTEPGGAQPGVDYVATSGSVTIPAGATSASVSIDTLLTARDGRNFFLYLSAATNAAIGDHYGQAILQAARPHHLRIVHDGSGLTCQREQVTLQACADASCSQLFPNPVQVTLGPSGRWIGGDTHTVTGSGVLSLRQTTPGAVTPALSAASPAPHNGTRCFVNGTEGGCALTFFESGFVFDVPDQTACAASAPVLVSAVRADASGERCVADGGFANRPTPVSFWTGYLAPGTGSRQASINGSAVAPAAPGTAIPLAFDANAQAAITVAYPDAGRLTLHARFTGSGEEAGLVMQGTDSFVVRPHGFGLAATTVAGVLLDNTAADGNPQLPAGETFHARIQAQCADGTPTPNYVPTGAELWVEMLNPADPATATAGNLYLKGSPPATVLAASFAAAPVWHDVSSLFSGGAITDAGESFASALYDEVGVVRLHLRDSDYLGAAIPESALAVGRFRPGRFTVEIAGADFAPANGTFTYFDQPFRFGNGPVVTITARPGGTVLPPTARTRNYEGAFWKLGPALTAGATAGYSYTNNIAGAVLAAPASALSYGSTVDIDGQAMITLHAAEEFVYTRQAAATAPHDADVGLTVTIDDGEASGSGTLAHIGFSIDAPGDPDGVPGSGDEDFAVPNDRLLRYGRLRLINGYGAEIKPVDVPLRAEYFDGTGFTPNALDSTLMLDLAAQIRLSNPETAGGLPQPGTTSMRIGGGSTQGGWTAPSFLGGLAWLRFSAPQAGNTGWVDVSVDLNSLPWLRYDWNGDGLPEDPPAARATFGIYRGSDNIIYLREVY